MENSEAVFEPPGGKLDTQAFYRVVIQLSAEVKQNTKAVAELTAIIRGEGINAGLLIEHERIKNQIDYDNDRTINERLCEIERIVAAGKWIAVLVIGSGLLNLIQFVWSLIMHESQVIHP